MVESPSVEPPLLDELAIILSLKAGSVHIRFVIGWVLLGVVGIFFLTKLIVPCPDIKMLKKGKSPNGWAIKLSSYLFPVKYPTQSPKPASPKLPSPKPQDIMPPQQPPSDPPIFFPPSHSQGPPEFLIPTETQELDINPQISASSESTDVAQFDYEGSPTDFYVVGSALSYGLVPQVFIGIVSFIVDMKAVIGKVLMTICVGWSAYVATRFLVVARNSVSQDKNIMKTTDSAVVQGISSFYGTHDAGSIDDRERRESKHSIEFNRAIKKELGMMYCHNGGAILDICGGKAGDFYFLQHAKKPFYYALVDVAYGSLLEAARRYNKYLQSELEGRHSIEFNRAIKKELGMMYCHNGGAILDICGGKAGDFYFLQHAKKPFYYALVDVAYGSLLEAARRYNKYLQSELEGRVLFGLLDGNTKRRFSSRSLAGLAKMDIIWADTFRHRLCEYFEPSQMKSRSSSSSHQPLPFFDYIQCHFALHYSWESEDRARMLLRNVSELLKDGEYFICTFPDKDTIISHLHALSWRWSEDNRTPPLIGNDLFRIQFEELPRPPSQMTFGAKYYFSLKNAVTNVPEFLVDYPLLKDIAREHSLVEEKTELFSEFMARKKRELFFTQKKGTKAMDSLRKVIENIEKDQQSKDSSFIYRYAVFKRLPSRRRSIRRKVEASPVGEKDISILFAPEERKSMFELFGGKEDDQFVDPDEKRHVSTKYHEDDIDTDIGLFEDEK
ncbi:mRNA cap guanine-N7 methyltransferase like protein [Aduncisulcus paluster]|uniref:mRNA (guanine-N(7))-methyltransferase n=1 Tax=Aduncisulcus paluster TaxID=2918883 RepID=A0ABQ5KQY1_9EUKA|nr:mRNA cap guanine-N7 methyltransferase like protein [Aduncisulcus paluster]